MRTVKVIAAMSIALAVVLAPLAAPPEAKSPTTVPEARFECVFRDGSLVMATAPDASLAVKTRYGTLSVPVRSIVSIKLGLRTPDDLRAKLDKAIDRLASPEYRDREAAAKELVQGAEHAIPLLEEALRSEVPEVVERAQEVMRQLKQTLAPEQFEAPRDDTIETEEQVLRGRIEANGFGVTTKHFGKIELKLGDLIAFRREGTGKEPPKPFPPTQPMPTFIKLGPK